MCVRCYLGPPKNLRRVSTLRADTRHAAAQGAATSAHEERETNRNAGRPAEPNKICASLPRRRQSVSRSQLWAQRWSMHVPFCPPSTYLKASVCVAQQPICLFCPCSISGAGRSFRATKFCMGHGRALLSPYTRAQPRTATNAACGPKT